MPSCVEAYKSALPHNPIFPPDNLNMGRVPVNKVWDNVIRAWSRWWQANNPIATTLLITCFLILFVVSWYFISRKGKPRLPPGPRGLPILGNLPFIDAHLNVYFEKLAKTFGPIFKIRLGGKLCVVIGSSAVAKEVLKDKDAIFANRPLPILAKLLFYGGRDITWTPLGAEWRMLRMVFSQEIMSKISLNATYGLRRQEVHRTLEDVYTKVGKPVNVSEQIFLAMLNVIFSQLWGGLLEGEERNCLGQELKQATGNISYLLGTTNISDFFPALTRFDLQGLQQKMKKNVSLLDNILDSVIGIRLSSSKTGERESKDLLDVLLKLKDQDLKTPFTMTHLKALFLDFILAGTDTSETTMEWAMARLMKHENVMEKLEEEIERVVGRNRHVEEADLPNLHYLSAVVKETLRLHPAGPLLVPRCPTESSTVAGYTIPEGTQIFVNAWAIHRDPEFWDNPLEFQPERFLTSRNKWDYSGNDHLYMPFGSGRRICPGIPLVERMVPYTLASFVHMFKWSLPEGTDIEFSETFGLSLKKKIPLFAIPTPRYADLGMDK